MHLVLLVDRVDRREPDRARALARGDLDGERVQPADGPVQRDRAEHRRAGRRLARPARTLRGRAVVRLELEAREAELDTAPRQCDVADLALDDVGRDVDVRVERAAHELARALRRDKVGHVGDTR